MTDPRDVDWDYPCKTKSVRDDYKDHVARGSVLPGLDFACDTGDKVFAVNDGKVILADKNAEQVRGRNIIIKHGPFESHYLHLSKLAVSHGQRVKRGDLIGWSGNTGTTSTGAHLHFAMKKDGKPFDPAPLLKRELVEKRKERKAAAAVVAPVAEVPEVVPE